MLMIILAALIIIINILCHPASSLDYSHECSNQTCGSLNVSYPFSLTSHCPSFSHHFELWCNSASGKLYMNIKNATSNVVAATSLQVTHINNDSLIVDITTLNSSFNSSSDGYDLNESYIELPSFPGPYVISNENLIGGFGCTVGIVFTAKVTGSHRLDFEVGGCYVSCPDDINNPQAGNQTGCVSALPTCSDSSCRFVRYYAVQSFDANATACQDPCQYNYANLFHPQYTNLHKKSYGFKLNWALPSEQISDIPALTESSDYACSNNSHHTIVHGVPGYLCSCKPGYEGDGYKNGSRCKDVDECKDPSMNTCIPGSTNCQNLEGSYTCKCNSPFHVGEGRKDGSPCRFSPHVRSTFAIGGAILGLALLMGGLFCLAIWWRRRTKRKYFMQNGGLQLQAYIASQGRERTRLFKSEELQAATNNYSDQMKLGVGGFGTVFKGTLEDGTLVAIKKANRGIDGDNEQFLNEMAILMQINHKHIVKLLGCCLETAVPLLVYEYVSNGSVAENLKSKGGGASVWMGWEQRLKVARQTAEALAYLHAAASPPILHRDVKPANVLLDDNLDVKVADFGVSRLVPDGVDELHVSTVVQGTIGYLDPEYFQTLHLTDKSDVYSFGIMLVELITGLKPVVVDSSSPEPCFTNLALLFIARMQEGKADELIDPRLEKHPSIMAVATLAQRCLALLGAQRPSMSHVVDELRRIIMQCANAEEEAKEEEAKEEEALPLLASKQEYEDYIDAGTMVAAQYYVQSSANNSMFIHNPPLNFPTMPR